MWLSAIVYIVKLKTVTRFHHIFFTVKMSRKKTASVLFVVTATVLLVYIIQWQSTSTTLSAKQPPVSPQMKDINNRHEPQTTHRPFVHSGPISKDMVVRSVYFDDRARNGHNNVSMFLVSVNRTIFDNNWIVGCGVGNREALEFTARFTAVDYRMHPFLHSERPFPYEEFIVECYDLPVVNGSPAFVMYKTANNSPVYVVDSENPLLVPAPRIQPSGEHNFTVVTCSKAHDKGVTWLPEFVRYQRTIGVDHVHINILDTFIKDGGLMTRLKDPYLTQAVVEGFLSFTVWTEWYDENEIYLHSELLRKMDCMYRFRGTYDYAFPLDTDDFFTPRVVGMKNLKDYILKWCYGDSIGSCRFDWVFYYPEACGLNDERIDDGNVTKKLRSYVHEVSPHNNRKSLHATSALVDATFHEATCKWCLMPGYMVVDVPLHIGYVAHLRMNRDSPPSGCT